MAKIDSVYDFTEKGLVELKSWLEPWFLTRDRGGSCCFMWEDVGAGCSGATSFSDTVTGSQYASCLLGYWRLGEAASPFADINPYLSSHDLVKVENGADYTIIAGALAGAQDDGAVQFNGLGYETPGDYLSTGVPGDSRYSIGNHDFTFLCWVNPTADAAARDGGIGGSNSMGVFTQTGWWLEVIWPGLTLNFNYWEDLGSNFTLTSTLTAGVWSFVVATYSTAAGGKLYVNGALVDSDATIIHLSLAGAALAIGKIAGHALISSVDTLEDFSFKGGIDEAALFQCELTADQVLELYTAGTT